MPIRDDTYAYRRNLPHLQKGGKSYFITFRTHLRRVLSPIERDIALGTIVADRLRAYWLYCAIVMPDHVHLICTPYEGWRRARRSPRCLQRS